MSIEIQSWPCVEVKTSYTVKLVRYRVIYRGAASSPQIAVSATFEFLPPVGLVNSEGINLFIGFSL